MYLVFSARSLQNIGYQSSFPSDLTLSGLRFIETQNKITIMIALFVHCENH